MTSRWFISGLPASGKTTVAKHLSRLTSAPVVDVGDVLREALAGEGVLCEHRSEIGPKFIKQFGRDSIHFPIIAKVRQKEDVIVDGVRLPNTLSECKKAIKCRTLYVHADDKERKERKLSALTRNGLPVSEAILKWNEYSLFDDEARGARYVADEVIENTQSLDELFQRIRALLVV